MIPIPQDPDWRMLSVLIAAAFGVLFAFLVTTLGKSGALIFWGACFLTTFISFIILNIRNRYDSIAVIMIWGIPFFLASAITLVIKFRIGYVVN
jgi:hypothetical protein